MKFNETGNDRGGFPFSDELVPEARVGVFRSEMARNLKTTNLWLLVFLNCVNAASQAGASSGSRVRSAMRHHGAGNALSSIMGSTGFVA
jgi:hypothetical protein